MSDLASAMLTLLIAWAGLALGCVGLGALVMRAFGLRLAPGEPRAEDNGFLAFWVGWVFVLVMLQFWHLMLPVNAAALAVLAVLSVAGLAQSWRAWGALIWTVRRAGWAFWIALGVVLLWLANRSIGGVTWDYDTGLYHLQAVRWAEAYAIVPGLGNLHGRLAFNSSYYLYAAALDAGPWGQRAHYLAHGLLYAAAFTQMIWTASRLLKHRQQWAYRDLLTVLLLAPVVHAAFDSAPTGFLTDIPVFLVGIMLTIRLFAFLETSPATPAQTRWEVFTLVLLASAGVTIKLSIAAFAGTTAALACAVWLRRAPQPARRAWLTWLIPLGTAALVLIPWMARGVILSGYPAYPNTLGAMPVEWRVPRAQAINEAAQIKSWARAELPADLMTDGTAWIKPWLDKLLRTDGARFTGGLLVAALFMLAERRAALRAGQRALDPSDENAHLRLPWLVVVPAGAALGVWFWMAPAYRFAELPFWVISAGLFTLALRGYGRADLVPVIVVALALGLSVLSPVSLLNPTEPGSDGGFYPLPAPQVEQVRLPSGDQVVVPIERDQCWDAPLPCAPGLPSGLVWRDPDDMSAGFITATAD